ncbi:MAG: adenylate/guanylate cyclase domain-containing protein [Geminicoccaceae bacterium]
MIKSELRRDYEEALIASGLVDDVMDVAALNPLPHRIAEGEFLCKRGEMADQLWIIVQGAVAVRSDRKTLYVRKNNEVVGEQNLMRIGGRRSFDLVADEMQVEILAIHRDRIFEHTNVDLLWRNIAKIVSLKLMTVTAQVVGLMEQIQSDAHILRAYTNGYALSRRLSAGGRYLTDYRVEHAVVWFSDLVDFGGLALKLSPMRAADLLQEVFNAQVETINKQGGYVDKFVGDGLMAFWILPSSNARSRQESCEGALAAAIEAVNKVRKICVGAKALRIRIGLHIGEVLSGDFGSSTRHQFTLIGSNVNLAARLQQMSTTDMPEQADALGPIRASEPFYESLSRASQDHLDHSIAADVKSVGKLVLHYSGLQERPAI